MLRKCNYYEESNEREESRGSGRFIGRFRGDGGVGIRLRDNHADSRIAGLCGIRGNCRGYSEDYLARFGSVIPDLSGFRTAERGIIGLSRRLEFPV